MTKMSEDKIAKAKELLLDPFQPVFPLPGMWHVAFGYLFSMLSFAGALFPIFDLVDLNPGYAFAILAMLAVTVTTLVLLSAKGFKLPSTIILCMSLAPIISIGILLIAGMPIETSSYIFLGFSFLAFLLLRSTPSRALVAILSTRRQKIKQMKRDGTYENKLAEARKRWG